MDTPERRRSLIGPLLLIAAGVLFLLGNLGLLGMTAWELFFRIWPIILIALGLDLLIGRRSLIGSLVVVVVVVAVIAGVLLISPMQGTVAVESQSISQPLEGATAANVEIDFGAGDVRVGALAEGALLIEGTVWTEPNQQIEQSFEVANGTASYKLGARAEHQGPFNPWNRAWGARGEERPWDLRLNRNVPIQLELDGGVGQAVLDLSELKISDLEADLGVGRTSITIPATGQVQASINAGVGEVEVIVPQGMAARIQAESGLGGVNVPGGYTRQGEIYTSPGYETAENRADLRITGGVGSVFVR